MNFATFGSDISTWADFYNAFTKSFSLNSFSVSLDLVSYVLLALGLYTIAKRRGINHAWLAWIPVGNVWLLGCISDQYRYVARREEKNKRKVMLILELLIAAACIAMIAFVVILVADALQATGFNLDAEIPPAVLSKLIGSLGLILILVLVVVGLSIALTVLMYMAYYDLFASCDPNSKTLYLILGILLSNLLLSLFVFICRKKDHGMPPRRDATQPEPPVWTPPTPQSEPWDF